ncbi:MAG: FKBP-type peptidyl-prolyl cis-trans isomerase [Caulobacteraceae bacterium]|nr:FKBP-type peptidyl-prolyl cis-trans isomerase [Caulobacteraceae bacterium]
MRFGWARAATATALAAMLLVAACHRAPKVTAEELAKNAAAAAAFMEKNKSAEGVQTLPSGLQYKVLVSGPSGAASPDRNDLVKVDYEGALTDGTVFDSSFERGVPLAIHVDEVVPGWTEALQRMKAGDEWMLYVPPELGYKDQQAGDIPPNSVLVFRVKLEDVAPVPGAGRAIGSAQG